MQTGFRAKRREKEKAVQVYTFKITYLGVENRIWRTAQVSSNYDLARLGFMVLSTFDTLACHLFGMTFKGVRYFLDIEELESAPEGIVCSMLCMTRLNKLKMVIGDKLLMTYDYGCDQQFELELVSAEPMLRGKGTSYPKNHRRRGQRNSRGYPEQRVCLRETQLPRMGLQGLQYG